MLNPVVSAVIFFVGIFTSLHVTIALVVCGIALDHLLRILGVLLFKTMEILGKKFEKRRQKHHRLHSSPWVLANDPVSPSPGAEKSASGPFGTQTTNSSMTAVNEETAPLGNIKLCQNAAAKENYRFPGSSCAALHCCSG